MICTSIPGHTLGVRSGIDYILMRQTQMIFCHDVSVIHRADYWTDHKRLQAKVVVQVFKSKRGNPG